MDTNDILNIMKNKDFMNIMMFAFIIGVAIFFYLITRLRIVPHNSTIIIDRNSHFHKKKSRGLYFINPKTDKITTIVSTMPITERYVHFFKTHDDYYYRVLFEMTYVCNEPNQTLDALSDSRRSIYDIANCACETLFNSLIKQDISTTNLDTLSQKLFNQLESTLEFFYIDVTNARIINFTNVDEINGEALLFRRHESSGGDPIQ